MEDCIIPWFNGDTVEELQKYALDLQGSLMLCNEDKAALRAFYKNLQQEE